MKKHSGSQHTRMKSQPVPHSSSEHVSTPKRQDCEPGPDPGRDPVTGPTGGGLLKTEAWLLDVSSTQVVAAPGFALIGQPGP